MGLQKGDSNRILVQVVTSLSIELHSDFITLPATFLQFVIVSTINNLIPKGGDDREIKKETGSLFCDFFVLLV